MDKNELRLTVEKARGGNTEAFERLYEEYRERLFFFAVKNVGSREAAEDVVSETFVAAMEGIGSLREGEAFGGWLYSIAYKKCMDFHNLQSRIVGDAETLLANAELNEPMELPENYAVSEQTRQIIKELIDGLPADQRSAVILYYYEEQSLAEIGKALGIKDNTVKQKLLRVRKTIKKGIEKRFGEGAVLAAVPLGAALDSSLESSYVKAVTSGARVKGMGIGARIATVGAIAAVAVALPIGISKLGGGDYRPEEETASDIVAPDSADVPGPPSPEVDVSPRKFPNESKLISYLTANKDTQDPRLFENGELIIYSLVDIPAGYELSSISKNSTFLTYTYEKETARIEFSWGFGTEGNEYLASTVGQIGAVPLPGHEGYYYGLSADDFGTEMTQIYWSQDGYFFELDIPSDLSADSGNILSVSKHTYKAE